MRTIPGIVTCVGLALAPFADDAGAVGGTVRKGCENRSERQEARQFFREGIRAYERRDWFGAAYGMLKALEFDCGQEVVWVPVYGRWRYRYQPEIYLGLALHRFGHCLAEGRSCRGIQDWEGSWRDEIARRLADEDEIGRFLVDAGRHLQCLCRLAGKEPPAFPGECEDGSCVEVRNTHELYCPVVDWWIKLDDYGVGTLQIGEEGCEEVATPLDWFGASLRFWSRTAVEDTNVGLCQRLTAELPRVERACAALESGPGENGK